jgi:hypothetical protein
MIQLADLGHQRLDVDAACLKATLVEDEGWEVELIKKVWGQDMFKWYAWHSTQ